MGVARACVVGSGRAPACSVSVSKCLVLALVMRVASVAAAPCMVAHRGCAAWPQARTGINSCLWEAIATSGDDMQRKASARWQGTAKDGTGTLSTQSGTLKDTP